MVDYCRIEGECAPDERELLTELVRVTWEEKRWSFVATFQRMAGGWRVVRADSYPLTLGSTVHGARDMRQEVVAAMAQYSGVRFEV